MSSCQTVGGALAYVVSIVYSCEVSCAKNTWFCNKCMSFFLFHWTAIFLQLLFSAIDCQNGRVYKMCGPISDETCSSPVTAEPVRPTDLCIEGCYCPKGSALHKDQCIPRSECPCTLRQKTYQPSEQVPNDCNTWLVFSHLPSLS
jgi:Trypsin Inhibitor like cysteine rich domain